MTYTWEQQKGEPTLWYRRFTEFYLTGGEDRTLAGAFRTFKARHANSTRTARDFGRMQPSGDWTKYCAKWSWVSRSQSYDAHQAVLLRKAHANMVKRTNEKHLAVVQSHFAKLIQRTSKLDYGKVNDIGRMLEYAERLIRLERMLLGMPLQVEEVRAAEPADPGIARAIQESSTERIDDPEMIAEVLKILDAQGCFADDEPDAIADKSRSA